MKREEITHIDYTKPLDSEHVQTSRWLSSRMQDDLHVISLKLHHLTQAKDTKTGLLGVGNLNN